MRTTLQFKDYSFPYNPRQLEILRRQEVVELGCPPYGVVTQALGRRPTLVTGEGELFGPHAKEQFLQMVALFSDDAPGQLYLPGQPPLWARMTSLRLIAAAGSVLCYSFAFVEESTRPPKKETSAIIAFQNPYRQEVRG